MHLYGFSVLPFVLIFLGPVPCFGDILKLRNGNNQESGEPYADN
jgi:hypothetical protein